MKKTLALMFALSGLAGLGDNARAATLLATPVIVRPPAACNPTLDEKKSITWQKGESTVAGIKWDAGVSAGIGVFADCTRLSAEGSVGVNAKLFGALTVKALDVKLAASSKADHTNTIEYGVYAFGFKIKEKPLVSSTTPIHGAEDLGYILPSGDFDGSFSYAPSWAGGAMAKVNYNSVAQVAADIIYDVSPTEVTVRSIAAGNMSAHVDGSITYKGFDLSDSANFDAFRLVQSGRAQLFQDVGSTWKAEAVNMVILTDVLGVDVGVDVPVLGHKSLFSMTPGGLNKDYSFTKNVTKPF